MAQTVWIQQQQQQKISMRCFKLFTRFLHNVWIILCVCSQCVLFVGLIQLQIWIDSPFFSIEFAITHLINEKMVIISHSVRECIITIVGVSMSVANVLLYACSYKNVYSFFFVIHLFELHLYAFIQQTYLKTKTLRINYMKQNKKKEKYRSSFTNTFCCFFFFYMRQTKCHYCIKLSVGFYDFF